MATQSAQETARKAAFPTRIAHPPHEADAALCKAGPNDPDLLLITTLKNFAGLDGALAKGDAISKQFEGSVANANKATGERNQIRRILGTEVGQVLELK